jgi:hypothetical protein
MRFVTSSRSKGRPSRGGRDSGGADMPRAMENWWKFPPGPRQPPKNRRVTGEQTSRPVLRQEFYKRL